MKLEDLKIKIFADCATRMEMIRLAQLPYIKGFTTNPTLMRKGGVSEYEKWAKNVLAAIPDKPISFEVIADNFDEMERQARKIAAWGENVYVKIPVMNTKGQSSAYTIHRLTLDGIKVNVTAVMNRVPDDIFVALQPRVSSIISYFVGRVTDTGALYEIFDDFRAPQKLWASTREVLNIFQADRAHYDIITVPPEILAKLALIGKDLDEYSLETVKQFYDDAVAAGYTL